MRTLFRLKLIRLEQEGRGSTRSECEIVPPRSRLSAGGGTAVDTDQKAEVVHRNTSRAKQLNEHHLMNTV
jgi:hypothetical protein